MLLPNIPESRILYLFLLVLTPYFSAHSVGDADFVRPDGAEQLEDLTFGYFKYVVIDGAATITGYTGAEETVVVPGEIDGVPVTSIGDIAFMDCIALNSISIPEGVTRIGLYAFKSCTSLSEVNMPAGVEFIGEGAFYGCTGIRSITLPDSLTSIESKLFWNCTLLSCLEIPDKVTRIGAKAFEFCRGLGYVDIGVSVTLIEDNAFNFCTTLVIVDIPDKLEIIGDEAFSDCLSLRSLEFGDSLTSVGNSSFGGCKQLSAVSFGAGLNSIGHNAFYECYLSEINISPSNTTFASIDGVLFDASRTTLIYYPMGRAGPYTIPDGVTTIANSAFYKSLGLIHVVVPEEVTQIEELAFGRCSDLYRIYFLGEPPSINGTAVFAEATDLTIYYVPGTPGWSDTFYGFPTRTFSPWELIYRYSIIDGEVTIKEYLGSDAALTIPAEIEGYPVTKIDIAAFQHKYSLTSVSIPSSVTSIGSLAFEGCLNLTEISIPYGVENIDRSAFAGCCSLIAATIPDSVNHLKENTFINCTSLSSVNIGTGVASIDSSAFSGCSGLMNFDVPEGNSAYSSIDGVLYNAAGNILLKFPMGRGGSFVIPDGVIELGDRAFFSCEGLVGITIPGSVIRIGDYCFVNCTGLQDLTISQGVSGIGLAALAQCISLQSISIPDSITSIGDMVFLSCTNLEEVILPDNLTFLSKSMFSNCWSLKSINIPGSVSEIADLSFNSCTSLESVFIPDSVTTIGNSAFAFCYELTSITIGKSVASLGVMAFNNSSQLQSVYFTGAPPSFEGDMVFYNTHPDLVLYYLAGTDGWSESYAGVPTAPYNLFGGAFEYSIADGEITITKYVGEDAEVLIPDAIVDLPVTGLGPGMLSGCDSITTITLPASIDTVSADAFSGCGSLLSIQVAGGSPSLSSIGGVLLDRTKSILIAFPQGRSGSYEIPSGVSYLADNAFEGCRKLEQATIPSSVTGLGDGVFAACSALKRVQFYGAPPSLGNGPVFEGASPELCIYYFTGMPGWEESFAGIASSPFSLVSGSFRYTFQNNQVTIVGYDCGDTQAVIPETIDGMSVDKIADEAFSGCDTLVSILIPAGVSHIEAEVFSGCKNLSELSVAAGNAHFASVDGVLLDAPKSTLLTCPPGRVDPLTVPAGVTVLGEDSFAGCSGLKAIYFTGEPPVLEGDGVFDNASPALVMYYILGTSGWGPEYAGYPAEPYTLVSGSFAYGITDGEVFITHYSGSEPEVSIPAAIEGLPVTAIAAEAFSGNGNISKIIIPKSVTHINGLAFEGCTGLTNIEVERGNPVYRSIDGALLNASLTTLIQVPSGREGNYAVPESVTLLGSRAFHGCAGLTDIYFRGEQPALDGEAVFEGTGSGLVLYYILGTSGWGPMFGGISTSAYALTNGSFEYGITDGEVFITKYTGEATEAVIPGAIEGMPVTEIASGAFAGDSDLVSISIPESVTRIGEDVFAGCSSLENFYFDDANPAFAAIDHVMFDNSLGTLIQFPAGREGVYYLPESVTTLGVEAFAGCSGLTGIYFPGEPPVLEDGTVFDGTHPNLVVYYILGTANWEATYGGIPTEAYLLADGMFTYGVLDGEVFLAGYTGNELEVDVPQFIDGVPVTAITAGTFYGCSDLTRIRIPESITRIDEGVFSECSNLTAIEVSSSNPEFTSIDGVLFNASLTTLIRFPAGREGGYSVPGSVTTLGAGAFLNCQDLVEIYFTDGPPLLGSESVFEGTHAGLVLYYPAGADGWAAVLSGVATQSYLDWGPYTAYGITSEANIDTGEWLGWLEITNQPWVWHYGAESWLLVTEDVAEAGHGWIMILDIQEYSPGLWLYIQPGTSWGWSFGLGKWLYVNPGVLNAGAGWVYML